MNLGQSVIIRYKPCEIYQKTARIFLKALTVGDSSQCISNSIV